MCKWLNTPRDIRRSNELMNSLKNSNIHKWVMYNEQARKNRYYTNVNAGYFPAKPKKTFASMLAIKCSDVADNIKIFLKDAKNFIRNLNI